MLRQLTDEHKLKLVLSCRAFLTPYHAEGEQFLARILMEDEIWVYFYEPESKRQSMECQENFKSAPSAGKLILTLFWDVNGPIIEHYQEKGGTVNSVRYSTMLEEKLKPEIRSCRRGLLSKCVLLLRDKAQPHTAAATVTTVQKLKFETTNHPPYSPDLAPSDYHVCGMRKETLRGRRFHSDDEAKETVNFLLRQQPKLFLYWKK
jgi:histone-lysine N-methyltransferase SETMAR